MGVLQDSDPLWLVLTIVLESGMIYLTMLLVSLVTHVANRDAQIIGTDSLLLVLLMPLSDDVWLFVALDMVPIIVRVYIVENVPDG